MFHQASQVIIHRLHHSRINCHTLGLVAHFLRRLGIPVCSARHGHHVTALRNHAQLYRTLVTLLAQYLPTTVINAHVTVDKLLRRLHRKMHGLKRDVSKKGLLIIVAVDKLDGLIDEKARRIKVIGQLVFLPIGEPVGFFVNRYVGLLLPVVCPGVGHGHSAFETAAAGQQIGGHPQVPFAGHIRVVARVL